MNRTQELARIAADPKLLERRHEPGKPHDTRTPLVRVLECGHAKMIAAYGELFAAEQVKIDWREFRDWILGQPKSLREQPDEIVWLFFDVAARHHREEEALRMYGGNIKLRMRFTRIAKEDPELEEIARVVFPEMYPNLAKSAH